MSAGLPRGRRIPANDVCATVLGYPGDLPDQLSPSKWHFMGGELTDRVVDAAAADTDPIWLEFQKDSRYRGHPAPAADSLEAAMSSLDADGFKVRRRGVDHLRENTERSKVPMPKFFITWESLGVRAINRMIARRIYPIGLTDKCMNVDGAVMRPQNFLEHDVDHAEGVERLINQSFATWCGGSDDFSRLFYEQFDYDAIAANLSADDQVKFDLGYSLYFHEFVGNPMLGLFGGQNPRFRVRAGRIAPTSLEGFL